LGFLKRFKENFVDTSYIGTMVGGIIHDISLYAPEKYAKELGIEMDAYEETELDVECRIMLTHWAKKLSEERYQYRKVREEIMSKAMSISEEYFLRDRFKRDISTPKENFRQVFLEAWAQYEEVESMREFIATVSYRICTRVLGLDITKESNKEVFNCSELNLNETFQQ